MQIVDRRCRPSSSLGADVADSMLIERKRILPAGAEQVNALSHLFSNEEITQRRQRGISFDFAANEFRLRAMFQMFLKMRLPLSLIFPLKTTNLMLY